MTNDLIYKEGEPFYYQIGEVITLIPWWRPNYDRICKFLSQEEVVEIFNKYEWVEVIGNVLWDFDVTWDLDLRLIVKYGKEHDWNSIEDDINKLNHLALNEWRILTDISVTSDSHRLPTKAQVLSSYNEYTGEYEVNLNEEWLAKISYTKKVVGDIISEYDINNSEKYMVYPLTERYLVRFINKYHSKKIIDKILNSKKDILENVIPTDEFIQMGEEEFKKFQNY